MKILVLCLFTASQENARLLFVALDFVTLNENDIETVASEDSEYENEYTHRGDDIDDSSSVCYGENDCHLCDMKFMCLDDLCEHFQYVHQEYYQKTQLLVLV